MYYSQGPSTGTGPTTSVSREQICKRYLIFTFSRYLMVLVSLCFLHICCVNRLPLKTLLNIYMFAAALFTMAKRWEHCKCLLMDECISETRYIVITKYCSALKSTKILPHATMWVNLEDTMLSDIS